MDLRLLRGDRTLEESGVKDGAYVCLVKSDILAGWWGDPQPWRLSRFQTIQDAVDELSGSRGLVRIMQDLEEKRTVAFKIMANEWMGMDSEDFKRLHPSAKRSPWVDLQISEFLSAKGFLHARQVRGVYRDDAYTYVVAPYASRGDLLEWCKAAQPPGPEREHEVLRLATTASCSSRLTCVWDRTPRLELGERVAS